MTVEAHIESIIIPPLKAIGYHIVRVKLQGMQRTTLEVLIERIDGASITVSDCTLVSREISALLDVTDPIKSSYLLEVSSPGLDRPLMTKVDFERFCGQPIKFNVETVIEGRKRFRGLLKTVKDDKIVLELDDDNTQNKVIEIPLGQIRKAKLIPELKSSKLSRKN